MLITYLGVEESKSSRVAQWKQAKHDIGNGRVAQMVKA